MYIGSDYIGEGDSLVFPENTEIISVVSSLDNETVISSLDNEILISNIGLTLTLIGPVHDRT